MFVEFEVKFIDGVIILLLGGRKGMSWFMWKFIWSIDGVLFLWFYGIKVFSRDGSIGGELKYLVENNLYIIYLRVE